MTQAPTSGFSSLLKVAMLAACAALMPSSAQSATIYLCKSYGGGIFWSNTHCNKQQALIQRMTTVPDAMPFDQQVALAKQAAADAQRLATPQSDQTAVNLKPRRQAPNECEALDHEITRLDSFARQPHSGPQQDQIRTRRQAARSRQLQLDCR